MALKVKAVERLLKFDKESAGKYRYVMKPEMYSSLAQTKVIREAVLRSGVSQSVMQACWDAAGEDHQAWGVRHSWSRTVDRDLSVAVRFRIFRNGRAYVQGDTSAKVPRQRRVATAGSRRNRA